MGKLEVFTFEWSKFPETGKEDGPMRLRSPRKVTRDRFAVLRDTPGCFGFELLEETKELIDASLVVEGEDTRKIEEFEDQVARRRNP